MRIIWRSIIVPALLVLLLLSLPQCTNVIVPPASPRDPVSVFLVDHGRTPTLVLPAADGRIARYGYGDWKWYALRHNDLGHGLAALLWPTQGTLGRAITQGPPTIPSIEHQMIVGYENIYEIKVERARADALREKLDDIFSRNINTKIANHPYGMEFVHHPASYTCFHNSNHAVAGWLRELGCRVRGLTFGSRWAVCDE